MVKAYSARVGVKHKLTSAFHPRTNSKVERFNGIIKPMLRKYVNGAIHRWDDFLDASLWACRIRTHTATGFSPFYLTYGRDPRIPGDPLRPYIDVETAKDPRTIADFTSRELEALGQYRAAAEFRLEAMAEKDKSKWDAAIRPLDFEPGDTVLMTNEGAYGLEPKWKGPYIVVASYPEYGTYKLETLQGRPLDSLVHVDRLKLAHTSNDTRPQSTWYEPSSHQRRAPAETPSHFTSARPMNKRLKSSGGGEETGKQPPQPAPTPVKRVSEPIVRHTTNVPVVSIASSRRSSVVDCHLESPIIMEDIELPATTTFTSPPPSVILEQVVLESISNIPTAATPSSSDITMSSSSSDQEGDTTITTMLVEDSPVATRVDHGTQTEVEDTAMLEEMLVAREDHGTQTEVEDTAMLEETPVAIVDQGTQTEVSEDTLQPPQSSSQIQDDVYMSEELGSAMPPTSVTVSPTAQEPRLSSHSSTSNDVADTTMHQPEASEIAESSSQHLKEVQPDTKGAKQDVEKQEVSKVTGLTATQEDSIVAKLMEVIKQEKEEARQLAEKKKEEATTTSKEIEVIQKDPEPKIQDKPLPLDPKPSAVVVDPSSSRSHLKRPLERNSDSDHSDPVSNSDKDKQEGVPGVTPIKVGENVHQQQIDMPWFIERWNKNKRRIFKPNKLVKRIKKKLKTDSDAGPSS